MNSVVLDASALLALLQQEPGQERVLAALEDSSAPARISAVNFSEVAAKLVRDGVTAAEVIAVLAPFRRYVVDFTLVQAEQAGNSTVRRRFSGFPWAIAHVLRWLSTATQSC